MYSREGLIAKELSVTCKALFCRLRLAQHAEYFTTVVNFDYRIHPNWNLYLKGAYERAGIYKTNGHFEKGLYRTTWNAQACVEYFSMRNSELLLFAHFYIKDIIWPMRAEPWEA